jgi:hypothetical protein
MADPLKIVRRATVLRAESAAAWRSAIRHAHANGASLRQIAAAAGVTHVRILQVVKQRAPKGPASSHGPERTTE